MRTLLEKFHTEGKRANRIESVDQLKCQKQPAPCGASVREGQLASIRALIEALVTSLGGNTTPLNRGKWLGVLERHRSTTRFAVQRCSATVADCEPGGPVFESCLCQVSPPYRHSSDANLAADP